MARPAEQALVASQSSPQAVSTEGFDPSRNKTYPWRFDFWGPTNVEARQQAERWLARFGFSVGRRQRGSPSGVMFGDFDIMKWRNLRKSDIEALDGKLWGDELPVRLTFGALSHDVNEQVHAMNHAIAMETREGGDAKQAPSHSDDSAAIAQPNL